MTLYEFAGELLDAIHSAGRPGYSRHVPLTTQLLVAIDFYAKDKAETNAFMFMIFKAKV